MNYYGAGADLSRMRADEDYEEGLRWHCIVTAFLNGVTQAEADSCDSEEWACYGCPVSYKGSHPVPELIQQNRNWMWEVQAFIDLGIWRCPYCKGTKGWREICDADSIETSFDSQGKKVDQKINWGYIRDMICNANDCELRVEDLG